MATTTYIIKNAQGEQVATKSKKATAVDVAIATGPGATVETGAGTLVHEVPTKKTIKMSAPYTRVVPVPADVAETINGQRVAYVRKRVGFALLDAAKGAYTIWDLERGVSLGEVEIATTREAGRWFADEAPAFRASLANA